MSKGTARLGWFLFFIMLIITAVMAWQFIYTGKTELAADNRKALILEDFEKDFLLAEMRGFLNSVHQIIDGIEKDNMEQITKAAKNSGFSDVANVPTSLRGKLPLEMKKMGFSVHRAFDQMALDAEQLGDKEHTLSQLNEILATCTACHALYRVR